MDKKSYKRVHREICEQLCCVVCERQLAAPIHQCKNGHFTCSACNQKLSSSCAYCRASCNVRNLAMERLIKKTMMSCRYGCGAHYRYEEDDTHLDSCRLRPVECPMGCAFHDAAPASVMAHLTSHSLPMVSLSNGEGGALSGELTLAGEAAGESEDTWLSLVCSETGVLPYMIAVRKSAENEVRATLLQLQPDAPSDARLSVRTTAEFSVRCDSWPDMGARNFHIDEALQSCNALRVPSAGNGVYLVSVWFAADASLPDTLHLASSGCAAPCAPHFPVWAVSGLDADELVDEDGDSDA